MERKYKVELEIVVEDEVEKEYGCVEDMIYESTEDVPFSFEIKEVKPINDRMNDIE